MKKLINKKYPTFFKKDGSLKKETKKQAAEIKRLAAKLQAGDTLLDAELDFFQMYEARAAYEDAYANKVISHVEHGQFNCSGKYVMPSIKETHTYSDAVNHPSHYNSGKIEVIEAIEDWNLGYHLGNTVKYIARAGKKDASKEVEDLEKALWYLNRRILKLKAEKEGTQLAKPNDTSIQR